MTLKEEAPTGTATQGKEQNANHPGSKAVRGSDKPGSRRRGTAPHFLSIKTGEKSRGTV